MKGSEHLVSKTNPLYLLNNIMIELKSLKLIAQGGQAEIYELDSNKVIRALRNVSDEKHLKLEMSLMKSLKEKGKTVPEVYDYLELDGRPSIVMEKINGDTMLSAMKKRPFTLLKQAKNLAKLHLDVTTSTEGLGMASINVRAKYLIENLDVFDEDIKNFVLNILSELPEGTDICHGDFHPGNILIVNDTYYVIDWFGATYGEKLSDMAHTYILLRNTPKLPGISKFENFIIGLSGSIISNKYLSTCKKIYPFDLREFSKWMLVRASERLCYGVKTEKEALIQFVKECKQAHESGVDPYSWWKFI